MNNRLFTRLGRIIVVGRVIRLVLLVRSVKKHVLLKYIFIIFEKIQNYSFKGEINTYDRGLSTKYATHSGR